MGARERKPLDWVKSPSFFPIVLICRIKRRHSVQFLIVKGSQNPKLLKDSLLINWNFYKSGRGGGYSDQKCLNKEAENTMLA